MFACYAIKLHFLHFMLFQNYVKFVNKLDFNFIFFSDRCSLQMFTLYLNKTFLGKTKAFQEIFQDATSPAYVNLIDLGHETEKSAPALEVCTGPAHEG